MSPRISTKEKLKRLMEIFGREDKVLVPIVADPDSISCAVALKRLLWRRVSLVTIARVNEIKRPDNLALIRLLRLPVLPFSAVRPADYTRVALVDGQPDHDETLAGLNYDVIIDHHRVRQEFPAAFNDIRPQFGATATMMTGYLRAAGIVPSHALATALFYGIKTDTDTFLRPSIEEDVAAFRYLYNYADHEIVRKLEYGEWPRRAVKYVAEALLRLRVRRETGIAFLPRVDHADTLVLVADLLLSVQGVDTAVAAGVCQDRLVVVMRNVKARRNIGRLAERAFGKLGRAGGHAAAARAEMPLANLKALDLAVDERGLERLVRRSIFGRS